MATAKSRQDSPLRQAAPVLVLAVAAVLTVVALFPFFGPWVVPAWVGVAVASQVALPPLLTGPKDAQGVLTPMGPGEVAAKERFALWRALKTTVFGSHDGWVPTKKFRLSFVYAIAGAVLAGSWPMWDMLYERASWLVWAQALMMALLVSGVDAAWRSARQPMDPCPGVMGSDVWRSEYRTAVLIAATVSGLVVSAGVYWLIAVKAVLPATVVLPWGVGPLAFAAGVIAATGVAHVAVRGAALAPWRDQIATRATWSGRWMQSKSFVKAPPILVSHTRVGAAAVDVFEIPAVMGDAKSFVLSNSRDVIPLLGGGQTVVVMHVPNVDPKSGQDVPGTSHPTRVKIVSWADGDMPDVCDPATPTDVALLLLECGVTQAIFDFNSGWPRPLWVGAQDVAVPARPAEPEPEFETDLEAASEGDGRGARPSSTGMMTDLAAAQGMSFYDPDADEPIDSTVPQSSGSGWLEGFMARLKAKPAPEEPSRADKKRAAAAADAPQTPHVWVVELATTTISVGWDRLGGELLGGLMEAYGNNVVVGARNPQRMYVGPADQVELSQSMPRPDAYAKSAPQQFLSDLAEEAQWNVRWGAVSGIGVNFPTPQFSVREASRLASGIEINYLPFLTRNGEPAEQLFNAKTEAQMATGLRASPFVSVQPYPRSARNHDGARNPQALAVVWSTQAVPVSPAKIAPPASGRVSAKSAQMLVLRGQLDLAFDAAKLARPEVVDATALTRPNSRGHVWRLRVRLFGGVTLDRLRTAEGKLVGAMSVPWLRLSPDRVDGFVNIYVGDPSRATFVDAEASKALVAQLDWAQAFAESNIFGSNGRVPQLTAHRTLEHNTKVEVVDFDLPTPVSVERIKTVKTKLAAAAGKVYLDIRGGATGAQSATITCCIEDPMPFPAPFNWAAEDQAVASGKPRLPFATGVDGEPVVFDASESPHVMVAGTTGSGKSVVMQSFGFAAAAHGFDLYIADPVKGAADFKFLSPYARALAPDILAAAGIVKEVVAEVDRRKTVNSAHGVSSYTKLPAEIRPAHIVLMIDEFSSLMTLEKVSTRPSDDIEVEVERAAAMAANNARTQIAAGVGRITREARSAGVTLVLGAQKLVAADLDKVGLASLKTNLARVLMGSSTYGDRQSALRQPDSAPDMGEVIPPGRGLFEPSTSRPVLIQSWYDPREQEALADALATRATPLQDSDRLDLVQFARRSGSGLEALLGDDSIDGSLFGDASADDPDAPVDDLGEVDFQFDPSEFGVDTEVIEFSLDAPTTLVVLGEGAQGWTPTDPTVEVLRFEGSMSMVERMALVRERGAAVRTVLWADRSLGAVDPVFGELFVDLVPELLTDVQWSLVPDPQGDGEVEFADAGLVAAEPTGSFNEISEEADGGDADEGLDDSDEIPGTLEPGLDTPESTPAKRHHPPAIAGLWAGAEDDDSF